jgi:hypothetical protein
MKIECSNCMETISISFTKATVTYTAPASGRGGKRVEARTTTNTLFEEGDAFYSWEAPCCDDYWDSYEEQG